MGEARCTACSISIAGAGPCYQDRVNSPEEVIHCLAVR